MADVAADLKSWSATAASNSPTTATTVGTGVAPNLQEIQKVVRQDLANAPTDTASGTTTDLGAVASNYVRITGTTTITGFGTVSSGIWKFVRFAAALTLTHNSTSLILPGGANITTAAGDCALAVSEGSGNWRVLVYMKAASITATLAGTETLTNKTISLASNTLSATSAQLAAAVSDETGSGALVFGTSPTLVTPALGTPASGTLTNCTGVTEAGLNASIVSQGKLKTTTASGSALSSGTVTYTLTGGTFSWWTAAADSGSPLAWGAGNQAAGVLGFTEVVGVTNIYIDERYVQASPPYNLGNGDIPLFVMALMDSSGNIKGASVAPDPTWSYHGPTDITPQWFANGKPYRRNARINGVSLREALKDAATMRAFMAGELEPVYEDLEITQEVKNRDMDLFPHNWVGNDLTGLTVVMLEPIGPVVDRLALIHADQGAREVRDLILNGYLNIGNTRLGANAPRAVMPVRVTWK